MINSRKHIVIIFISLSIVVCSYLSLPARTTQTAGLVLSNDCIRLEFTAEHMGLSAMIDKIGKVNHVSRGKEQYLLWELIFKRGTQERSLTNNDVACTSSQILILSDGTQRAIMEWKSIAYWRENNAVNVRVTIDLPQNSGIPQWKISVQNNSTFWGLWEVRFPYFTGFLVSGEYDLAIPAYNWGYLRKKITQEVTTRGYPSGWWPMPFLSVSNGNNSVYLAALDPEAWFKNFVLNPGDKFYFTTYVEDMGVPGSDYPGHYATSVGVYQGNWLNACKMYRQWALQQYWTKEGPLSKRGDVPKSIKELGLWMLSGWDFGKKGASGKTPHTQNAPLLDAQKYFGVPTGLHWYNWHHMPFDNEYPHFFPPKDGFRERVAELVSDGLLIMPYINALISDYDNPDYQSLILPNAAKDESGLPVMHVYGTSSGRMTPMCVGTNYWQDKITMLVDSLTGYFGVNAVYLDQLAATYPILCFDKTHGHPLGGGGWWFKGYQKLLDKVQRVANERGAVITSESICESYMNGIDAFLTWIKRDETEIPMMPAVYSGYTLYFASPAWLDAGDRSFVAVQGRDFAWGCQNGWMGFELFEDSANIEKAAYLKQIGQYRMVSHKFLTYGELLDVIHPANPVDTITEVWANHSGIKQNATLPSVMGALWKSEDGHLGVFLTNFLNEKYNYSYEIPAAQYGLTAGDSEQYQITQIKPEGNQIIGYNSSGSIKRTEELGPREIKVLEIAVTEK